MKKVIFFVLSSLFILIVPSLKASAISYTSSWSNLTSDSVSVDLSGSWANFGNGTLNTSIVLRFNESGSALPSYIQTPQVKQVVAWSGSQNYVCTIGTNSIVNNFEPGSGSVSYSISSNIVYSVSCPMNMGENGLSKLEIILFRYGHTINYLSLGDYITFSQSDNSAIINSQQQTTNAINGVNDSINSDTVSSNSENSSTVQSWASNNASDSVVSDMVLMPITLLNAFSSGFNSSCQSYNLGSLFGTDLILPCINVENYLGSTLWGIIDVLMSGFLIYGIGKKFVKVFNDFTNLKDTQVDELYGGGNE